MRSQAKTAPIFADARRPAYRTIERWAMSILIDVRAIRECEEHGWAKNQNDPAAWELARQTAREDPFPGSTPEESLAAIDDVMSSIGDSCPNCN